MSKSNYPNSQIDNLPAEFVTKTISSIQELGEMKKITRDSDMDQEFENRVQTIIEFCKNRGMRIGIETLCAGLGISRQELHNWENGVGNVSVRRQEGVKHIKQLIYAFLEQAGMSGRLNPTTYVWLTKNWQGYRDVEIKTGENENSPLPDQTAADIAARHRFGQAQRPELPPELREEIDALSN